MVAVNEQLRPGLIIRLGKIHILGPPGGDGHRADNRVIFSGQQTGEDAVPLGGDQFDFSTKAFGDLA